MKNFIKILTFMAIMVISMICFAGCGDKCKKNTKKDNNESLISTTVTTEDNETTNTKKDNNESLISTTVTTEDNETTNTKTETSIITSVVGSTTNNSGTSTNNSNINTVTTTQEKKVEQNTDIKPNNNPSSNKEEFNNSNKDKKTEDKPVVTQAPQTTTVAPTATTTVTPKPSNPKDIGYWKDSEGNEHYFPDYNNQYVQKIYDSGLVDSSVYRGSTIVKTPTGWSVVFIGTGSNPSAQTYDIGFDTCDLDSATVSNLLTKIKSEGKSYMNAVASGDLPMVDLNGNGLLSTGEAEIVAIFMSGSYNFDGVFFCSH